MIKEKFDLVSDRLRDAHSIAWDGCHKLYILMDEDQTNLMFQYGYEYMALVDGSNHDELIARLKAWWNDSCGLRFINAVSSVEGDPNDGFETLIGQFDDENEEDAE